MLRAVLSVVSRKEAARIRNRLAYVTLLLLYSGACSADEPTTGSFYPTEGIVYGEIRDTAGHLQAGALVEVVVYVHDCDQRHPDLPGVPRATPDGRYRLLLRAAPVGEYLTCVVVNASAESDAGVLRGTVRDKLITLREARFGPRDSLRVDVVVK